MARILFIDDDENIRFLVQEELALVGHAVRTAESGLEGLGAIEEELPDAVILDVKMPGLGGLEVLGRIKASHPKLPVLLFTAYSDYKTQALELGADGYLVKSPDFSTLDQTLREVLRPQGGNRA